ncbi:MAG: hypothetical protein JOZ81_19525 [Chloroflexi bacterium]|nr:hypothetical protein [Chloroflexota bacterium]MBV9545588.1 hypothetical protein [Chloroflexota bacterium]
MTSGDDPGGGERTEDRDDRRDGRGERIGIGGADDNVTRIQLAARWSESYAPSGDTLGGILRRFRAAYEYLDAVTHGVEPPNIEEEQPDAARTPPAAQPVPGGAPPGYAPQPGYQPQPGYPQPGYQPPPEPPRPW